MVEQFSVFVGLRRVYYWWFWLLFMQYRC